MQNFWAFWSNAMPSLAHSTLGTSCAVACASLLAITASSHPWRCSNLERPVRVLDKPNEFLHAFSTSLIDAIPLSVLSKPRNFLWLGSPGEWNDRGSRASLGTVLTCMLGFLVECYAVACAPMSFLTL
ncbi:MAG TPA: hypothetical protein VMW91_01850 [Desulfosporosinus sp.]|nr:hypothetical protein [Desulfosporosinus sp.]